MYACFSKGFREKNRDLMRQDVVEVLKTSHMDLVRSLIGLHSYAAHKWRIVISTVYGAVRFRRCGNERRRRKQEEEDYHRVSVSLREEEGEGERGGGLRGKLKEKVWRRNREGEGGIEREREKRKEGLKWMERCSIYIYIKFMVYCICSSTCTV